VLAIFGALDWVIDDAIVGMIHAASADAFASVEGIDDCPNDPNKSDPGLCGCGVPDSDYRTWYWDGDGDGAGDPNETTELCYQPTFWVAVAGDACPDDPNKTQPGNCGCGQPEVPGCGAPQLPAAPSNPSPADGATYVSLYADLDWDDSAGAISYGVYFGTSNPLPCLGNAASSDWLLDTLDDQTTYYWQVVAKNDAGNTPGPVWSFSAGAPPVEYAWQPLGSGMVGGYNVNALTDLGGDLVAGGVFETAGDVECNFIARWDGNNWHAMGNGMSNGVYALTVFNSNVIAGGWFLTPARWDGSNWYPVGGGMSRYTYALAVSGGDLIAGGDFTTAEGQACNYIARWNGAAWLPLATGMNHYVLALTTFGGELIAGGSFTTAGGASRNRIARWDGSAWQPLGSGMNQRVRALTVYNGELVAGGDFTTAGGASRNRIARWDGSAWQALGSGMNELVYALAVFDGDLIAGGTFTTAGGEACNSIARWNGSFWQPLGSGMDNSVFALTVVNGELIAGGFFTTAGGVSCNHAAKWGPAP